MASIADALSRIAMGLIVARVSYWLGGRRGRRQALDAVDRLRIEDERAHERQVAEDVLRAVNHRIREQLDAMPTPVPDMAEQRRQHADSGFVRTLDEARRSRPGGRTAP